MLIALLVTAVIIIVTIRAAIKNARLIIASNPKNFDKYLKNNETGGILLITAHPDDECMFFSPTIVSIKKMLASNGNASQMHLLCLTSGDADGLGKVRVGELKKAARVLGFDSVHIHDYQDRIPDSMTKRWDINQVSQVIKDYLDKNKDVGTVITFDAFGISGHPNHCDVNLSVRRALGETLKAYDLFELITLPLALKYMGMTGIVYEAVNLLIDSAINKFGKDQAMSDHYVALIDWNEALAFGFGAMKCHQSQLVWFRRLYLIFSRYLHVNVLAHKKIIAPTNKSL